MERHTLIERLNPAVPRKYLFFIAGALWTVAGIILCRRGVEWMEPFSIFTDVELWIVTFSAAAIAYIFLFSKIVGRNIERILQLPERACLFAFTAFRGYGMIIIMISAGIFLRSTPFPKQYLVLPYNTMGSILLAGSLRFYRQFFRSY